MRLSDLPYSIADIFSTGPSGEFAFHMRFRRGDIAAFYANRPDCAPVLAERRRWLDLDSAAYAALLPEGEAIFNEALALAAGLGVSPPPAANPLERCIALGRQWEPEFLLLQARDSAQPLLVGGCVCFPSSWSFEEKMGRPLDAIHEPVPTLNTQFVEPVRQFLSKMKPGISWERINWGLSRSAELNQHPKRGLRRLDASVEIDEVWFRLEYQSLVALPASRGILFGIRLIVEPVEQLRANPEFAAGLRRALETMPAPVAAYKGLLTARDRLVSLL